MLLRLFSIWRSVDGAATDSPGHAKNRVCNAPSISDDQEWQRNAIMFSAHMRRN
jgi:hypothetical protein